MNSYSGVAYHHTQRKELSPRKNTRFYTKEGHSLPYHDNNWFRWLVLATGQNSPRCWTPTWKRLANCSPCHVIFDIKTTNRQTPALKSVKAVLFWSLKNNRNLLFLFPRHEMRIRLHALMRLLSAITAIIATRKAYSGCNSSTSWPATGDALVAGTTFTIQWTPGRDKSYPRTAR